MTTHRTIADTEVDADSPVTVELMTALRDNLYATAEGASGSPSMLGNIAANATAGAVGTYVFAAWNTNEAEGDGEAEGNTVAGSGLIYSGVSFDIDNPGQARSTSGATLSGTWRAMGNAVTPTVSGSVFTGGNVTLWVRIV